MQLVAERSSDTRPFKPIICKFIDGRIKILTSLINAVYTMSSRQIQIALFQHLSGRATYLLKGITGLIGAYNDATRREEL